MIFQIAEGSVFHDHLGFPLRPSLSLIYYAYIITIPLCIQLKNEELNFDWVAATIIQSNHFKPPSSINKRPVIMSNQCPEIIVVKNGKLNLDWAAATIIQSNHFKRPSSINKRPVIMSNQCAEITVVVNNGKLYLYWAPTAIKQSLPPFCLSHCSHLY